MGAYFFIKPKIKELIKNMSHKSKTISYIGRREAATTAVGYMKLHIKEQNAIIEQIFN